MGTENLNICETCKHAPICSYCDEHLEGFKLHSKDGRCDLYEPKRELTLSDTVEMMQSADYRERFKAEYYQTKIRHQKLRKMLIKIEAGTLEFTPTSPLNILREQKIAMCKYLYNLEVRAEIEGIEL